MRPVPQAGGANLTGMAGPVKPEGNDYGGAPACI
jgi:hypothetical protein